ncbi:MAG: glutaminyl-peptide cyclotransferase [Deltaproteobacteria bacterium]|nr:glutaminyl-peptide cyclotransferase [Deltaproteobacteria bacterium]
MGRHSSSEATAPTVTNSTQSTISYPAPVVGHRIINTYPHDPRAFTQGLVFADDVLYEGTGLRGQSSLRKVDLKTGNILRVRQLAAHFFGEGITIYGNRVIQLTWRAKVGFVYDIQTFQLLDTFNYPTEGWGITHDGRSLIMSDGTSTLYFLNPQTFQEVGRLEVHTRDGPVSRLNELEYVQGEIYANVWKTDRIAKISPETGAVMGWIDLEGLLRPEDGNRRIDVLNGIAYDVKNDRLFVTGKLWPKLFEIELIVPER